jgi:hypothetical protein
LTDFDQTAHGEPTRKYMEPLISLVGIFVSETFGLNSVLTEQM